VSYPNVDGLDFTSSATECWACQPGSLLSFAPEQKQDDQSNALLSQDLIAKGEIELRLNLEPKHQIHCRKLESFKVISASKLHPQLSSRSVKPLPRSQPPCGLHRHRAHLPGPPTFQNRWEEPANDPKSCKICSIQLARECGLCVPSTTQLATFKNYLRVRNSHFVCASVLAINILAVPTAHFPNFKVAPILDIDVSLFQPHLYLADCNSHRSPPIHRPPGRAVKPTDE
jgi:hypothetical protein